MKNSKLIRVPLDGRRAEPGVPGDRGLRGPREPGDPGPAGGGHAPDAASLHAPRVPMPGTCQARPGDPQVSGRGRAPYADLSEPEQSSYKARMHKVHRRRSKICTPRAPIGAKLSGKL